MDVMVAEDSEGKATVWGKIRREKTRSRVN